MAGVEQKTIQAMVDMGHLGSNEATLDAILSHMEGIRGPFTEAVTEASLEGAQATLGDMQQEIIAQGSQILVGEPNWQTEELIRTRTFEACQETLDRMTGDVRFTLSNAYLDGVGIDEAARRLKNDFQNMKDYELERIARTEIIGNQNVARHMKMGELKITYEQWWGANDTRTRGADPTDAADHTAGPPGMHGQITKVGDQFSNGLRFPGDRSGPIKEWINCFPAGTLVVAAETERAFRRFYNGDVITIETAAGHKLTGTPNHPVLTAEGWVALNQLEQGDHVISTPDAGGLAIREPDKYNKPTAIEQIFKAISGLNPVKRVSLRPVDFHGDGGTGDVDIVATDGQLGNAIYTPGFEQVDESGFKRGNEKPADLTRLSAETHGKIARADTADGLVSSGHLSTSLIGGHLGPFQSLGFGAASEFDPSTQQAPGHGIAADPIDTGQSLNALTGQIARDQIVTVKKGYFSGQVYNLQTKKGWYFANGIITHNCRCRPVPFIMPLGFAPPTGATWFYESDLIETGSETPTETSAEDARIREIGLDPKKVREVLGEKETTALFNDLDEFARKSQADLKFLKKEITKALRDPEFSSDLLNQLRYEERYRKTIHDSYYAAFNKAKTIQGRDAALQMQQILDDWASSSSNGPGLHLGKTLERLGLSNGNTLKPYIDQAQPGYKKDVAKNIKLRMDRWLQGERLTQTQLDEIVMRDYIRTQELLKAQGYPDTLTLYRGQGHFGKQTIDGIDYNVFQPKGVDSWSTQRSMGEGFGRHVMEAQVPRSKIYGAQTTNLAFFEAEYLWVYDKSRYLDPIRAGMEQFMTLKEKTEYENMRGYAFTTDAHKAALAARRRELGRDLTKEEWQAVVDGTNARFEAGEDPLDILEEYTKKITKT